MWDNPMSEHDLYVLLYLLIEVSYLIDYIPGVFQYLYCVIRDRSCSHSFPLDYRQTKQPESQILRPLVDWSVLVKAIVSVLLARWLVPILVVGGF